VGVTPTTLATPSGYDLIAVVDQVAKFQPRFFVDQDRSGGDIKNKVFAIAPVAIRT
jgi:hypothetical protein